MNRYVIGDLHGRYDAFKELLIRINFDYDNDKLICLGDIADGGSQVYQCVEECLKIKNFIFVLGNHDNWFISFMKSGWHEKLWLHQGGLETLKSYPQPIKPDDFTDVLIPVTHQEFFDSAVPYYIEDNMIFVHGGFDDTKPIEEQTTYELTWDRNLWHTAMKRSINIYDKVFIGHSTTQLFYNNLIPLKFNNLWMLDTGAGWSGKLTIMNIDTEEYWQSDILKPVR